MLQVLYKRAAKSYEIVTQGHDSLKEVQIHFSYFCGGKLFVNRD